MPGRFACILIIINYNDAIFYNGLNFNGCHTAGTLDTFAGIPMQLLAQIKKEISLFLKRIGF